MWFDIFIYSFSLLVAVVSGIIINGIVKPVKKWEKLSVACATLLSGLCAFLMIVFGVMIVVVIKSTT